MVYCSKCGAKNSDDAKACTQCGASLYPGVEPTRRYERQREEECFGLPGGGAIAGIIFGIIIILAGLSWFLGFDFWENFGFILIIILGVLILAGALYRLRRRS